MNAELFLLGKRIDMAPRANRRRLVMLVYLGLAALVVGLWLINRWHLFFLPLMLAIMFVNSHLLGGEFFGGIVKPFSDKAPKSQAAETSIGHVLRWGFHRARKTSEHNLNNDERELWQRDHAHWRAYRTTNTAIFLLWFVLVNEIEPLHFLDWLPIPTDLLLYGLATAAWIISETLPQAILLWTEPDMESEA